MDHTNINRSIDPDTPVEVVVEESPTPAARNSNCVHEPRVAFPVEIAGCYIERVYSERLFANVCGKHCVLTRNIHIAMCITPSSKLFYCDSPPRRPNGSHYEDL